MFSFFWNVSWSGQINQRFLNISFCGKNGCRLNYKGSCLCFIMELLWNETAFQNSCSQNCVSVPFENLSVGEKYVSYWVLFLFFSWKMKARKLKNKLLSVSILCNAKIESSKLVCVMQVFSIGSVIGSLWGYSDLAFLVVSSAFYWGVSCRNQLNRKVYRQQRGQIMSAQQVPQRFTFWWILPSKRAQFFVDPGASNCRVFAQGLIVYNWYCTTVKFPYLGGVPWRLLNSSGGRLW